MQALLSGAKLHGIEIKPNDMNADAAVIWSVLWFGRMSGNKSIYEHFRKQNKPVFIVEVGSLCRNVTWKISLNHVNALGYYGHTQNLNYDRPKILGVELKNQVSNNGKILIAGQHAHSLQVADLPAQEVWINDMIEKVRTVSNRPIVVRPHPRSRIDVTRIINDVEIQQPKKILDTYDSFDFSTNYHVVINHNSGPGIQAAVAGARACVDKTSLVHPVSIELHEIEQHYNKDRTQWFVELCHTEYFVSELAQGIWYQRLQHGQ
jgi:hypothetical protein